MALLDPVATVEEYRAATGRASSAGDAQIFEALVSNTRRLERMAKAAPGYWQTHSATYDFDARGGPILRLRQNGRGYCFTAITANSLQVDDDDDGTYEYSWDTADAWIRPEPVNASTASEPYKAIRILTGRSAPRTTWPNAEHSVRIAGTWGWAAVPRPVRAAVIEMAREELEAALSGSTRQLFGPDGESFQLAPDPVRIAIGRAMAYGPSIPRLAAV